jgi:hypothetical protein
MSTTTNYYDKNKKDIGEYFMDLNHTQTIYGIKKFTTAPIISNLVSPIYLHYGFKTYETSTINNVAIPTGAKYCNIEICSGGGGGGGGGSKSDKFYSLGGSGGAGGTYYNLTLSVNDFNKYDLSCGSGGIGGDISNSDYGNNGDPGGSSYIKFYNTNNPDTSYNLLVNGGGRGMGGKQNSSSFGIFISQIDVTGGVNSIYNNDGSYYTYENIGGGINQKIMSYTKISTFNQPSGGGHGISYIYSEVLLNGTKGGSIFFNNENSNTIYAPCDVNISASSSNPFNGGGGGNNTGSDGGSGFLGGGGGGGGGGEINGGKGGNGGDGFITLYFY